MFFFQAASWNLCSLSYTTSHHWPKGSDFCSATHMLLHLLFKPDLISCREKHALTHTISSHTHIDTTLTLNQNQWAWFTELNQSQSNYNSLKSKGHKIQNKVQITWEPWLGSNMIWDGLIEEIMTPYRAESECVHTMQQQCPGSWAVLN